MSGFACMECGHKFKTIKAAERASLGDKGCPKCGGADIDLEDSPAGHTNAMADKSIAEHRENMLRKPGGMS